MSDRRFRQPDGTAYDLKNDRLFVSDKYNNRVLIFDVRPEVLGNFPAAIGVLGETELNRVRLGPENPRYFADRIYDPRGSIFDNEDQRLFLTDVFNARINVYTFPREQFRVDLPARAGLKYESLDARTSVGAEDLMVGHAEVQLNQVAAVLGTSVHLLTRTMIEPQSERESRVLISEAQLPVAKASTRTQVFFDNRNDARVSLSVVNPNEVSVSVDFELRLQTGAQQTANRQLGAGEQLSVEVAQLFGGVSQQSTGSLWIQSQQPVQVGALLQLPNGRGDYLMVPSPVAQPEQVGTSHRVLPQVVTGAGYQMSYVLMNPSSEPMRGTLEIEGREVGYTIEPGSLFYREEAELAQPVHTSYAMVRAQQGGVPVATGLLSLRRRDGTLQTARVVGSDQQGTLFWAPVDTNATLLRHGEIKLRLTVVNEGPVPATVYLELFDIDGNSQKKYERIVPLGKRMEMGLEDVFGESRLRGTMRVFSDSEVSLTLEKRVLNVEDELIFTQVPLQPTPETALDRLVFPAFSNGSGVATELWMINTDRSATDGQLSVKEPQGSAVKTVLR